MKHSNMLVVLAMAVGACSGSGGGDSPAPVSSSPPPPPPPPAATDIEFFVPAMNEVIDAPTVLFEGEVKNALDSATLFADSAEIELSDLAQFSVELPILGLGSIGFQFCVFADNTNEYCEEIAIERVGNPSNSRVIDSSGALLGDNDPTSRSYGSSIDIPANALSYPIGFWFEDNDEFLPNWPEDYRQIGPIVGIVPAGVSFGDQLATLIIPTSDALPSDLPGDFVLLGYGVDGWEPLVPDTATQLSLTKEVAGVYYHWYAPAIPN